MGNFLDNISSAISGNEKEAALVLEALKVVPAIIGFNQANKAKQKEGEYLQDIKDLEASRQKLVNPYAQVSNPYKDLAVATKAAEMQAEQSDIALANTLDALRQTGAGGATALAQAALKSKQGIAANIEKQEIQNDRLAAQGQLQVDLYRAKGEADVIGMQEKREEAQLDRLQGLADIEALIRQQGLTSGVGSVSSMLSGGAKALINPQATDFSGMMGMDQGYGATPTGTTLGADPDTGELMSFAPK